MHNHQHTFRKINEDSHGILEVCTECKYRLVTRKDPKTARIDNKKYLETHQRDTAQPTGRTSKVFKKYYGSEAGVISRFK